MSEDRPDTKPVSSGRRLNDPLHPERQVEVIYALPQGYNPALEPQNEPTLADLMRLGWSHKWRLILPALILGVLAAGVSLQIQNSYTYSTVIEIGSTPGTTAPLEAPEDVRLKIERAFIPSLVADLLRQGEIAQDDLESWQGSVKIDLPRNSTVLNLSSTAPLDKAHFHQQMLNRVVDRLVTDHERTLNAARQRLHQRIDATERELEAIKDRRTIINKRQAGLETERKLIDERLVVIDEAIRQAIANRKQALAEVTGQAQALTLMMIDSAMQTDRNQQASFMKRNNVDIPIEMANLDKELTDLQRSEREIAERIALLRLDLEGFRNTRSVVPPTRSLRKSGPKRSLIAIGGAMAGGIFGLVWVIVMVSLRSSPQRP